jgi:hypothetical protein
MVAVAGHMVAAAEHMVAAAEHMVAAVAHRAAAVAHRAAAVAHRAEELRAAAWAARLQTDSCCTRAAEAVATMQGVPTVQTLVVSDMHP